LAFIFYICCFGLYICLSGIPSRASYILLLPPAIRSTEKVDQLIAGEGLDKQPKMRRFKDVFVAKFQKLDFRESSCFSEKELEENRYNNIYKLHIRLSRLN